MRSIAKPILIIAGGALLLLAAIVLIANIYLQSEGVQDRMRAAISRAAGVPVKIEHSSFTPWSGFTFSGLSVPQQGHSKVPVLSISSLRVRVHLLSLLQREIEVKEVVFLNPVFISTPTSSGRWPIAKFATVAPPAPAVLSLSVPDVGPILLSPPSVKPPLTSAAPQSVSEVSQIRTHPEVQVDAVKVRNGKAIFYDAMGQPLQIGRAHV